MSMKYQSFTKASRQQGWTFWSLLTTMAVAGFFVYAIMRLVPIYSANQNIKNAMEVALEGEDLRTMNRAKVLAKLKSQLYLDGNHLVLNYKTDLVVKRSRKSFIVETNYNREVPLVFNLSLKADFHNVLERNL